MEEKSAIFFSFRDRKNYNFSGTREWRPRGPIESLPETPPTSRQCAVPRGLRGPLYRVSIMPTGVCLSDSDVTFSSLDSDKRASFDWNFFYRPPERLTSLGILEAQFKALLPLKPPVPYSRDVRGVSGRPLDPPMNSRGSKLHAGWL